MIKNRRYNKDVLERRTSGSLQELINADLAVSLVNSWKLQTANNEKRKINQFPLGEFFEVFVMGRKRDGSRADTDHQNGS